MRKISFLFFCCYFFAPLCLALKNCRVAYNAYYQCLNQVNNDFNSLKVLTDAQWNTMENNVQQQCFIRARCTNPWGSDAAKNKRRSCFRTQRNRFRGELLRCVRLYYDSNFDLPQEALVSAEYSYFTSYVTALSQNELVCDATVNKAQVAQCVRGQVTAATNKSRTTGNKCQAKQSRCDAKMSDAQCYDQWQRRIRPGVKSCVAKLTSGVRLQNYRDAVKQCVTQPFPMVLVPNNDPFLQYFSTVSTAYANIPETCARRPTSKLL